MERSTVCRVTCCLLLYSIKKKITILTECHVATPEINRISAATTRQNINILLNYQIKPHSNKGKLHQISEQKLQTISQNLVLVFILSLE